MRNKRLNESSSDVDFWELAEEVAAQWGDLDLNNKATIDVYKLKGSFSGWRNVMSGDIIIVNDIQFYDDRFVFELTFRNSQGDGTDRLEIDVDGDIENRSLDINFVNKSTNDRVRTRDIAEEAFLTEVLVHGIKVLPELDDHPKMQDWMKPRR